MKQGEIWSLNFDPTTGREWAGYRPALIISGDLMNKYLDVVIVCPLTTSVKNYKGNCVLEPSKKNGLKKKSEILTFHIRSVSKHQLSTKLGQVEAEEIHVVLNGLNDILRY